MKKEKGLSLIEASMVLALSAIVVSGVMYYYSSASEENDIQNTMGMVENIISKINALYTNQSTTRGISTSLIAKQIPSVKTADIDGSTYIMVPGSSTQLSVHRDNGYKRYYIRVGIPKMESEKKAYGVCMAVTGGSYGSSFLYYALSDSTKKSADQSVKARGVFCESVLKDVANVKGFYLSFKV